jgi:ABC-2 type transport system ATP-binding protein
VIELVELDAKRDERVAGLSGGQRRRLDLALALIGDPDLLFLDEPTTGFDPHARRQAWAAIRSLCSLGKTVFLTTHYMDEAQALADRVAVMAGGKLVAIGPPAQLAGRDSLPTEIRFGLPAGVEVSELPELDGQIGPNGAGVLITTSDSVAALHRLTGWALERDVALAGLAVSQPSLEDVYLSLTTETAA